eukprot:TRINITY_DN1568_c1_g1_i1.p1 TRINITY_DN1568_c1_g1~~TRINITY_DN1568_c1_g1_i1.p1  ORF type:complete len:1037 (+),score=218.33 TRINITY_DN1568_c1_g1_i1:44-3154(+)
MLAAATPPGVVGPPINTRSGSSRLNTAEPSVKSSLNKKKKKKKTQTKKKKKKMKHMLTARGSSVFHQSTNNTRNAKQAAAAGPAVKDHRLHYPDDGEPYRRGYEPNLIFIDGQEYSFEEVRAAARGHFLNDADAGNETALLREREITWRGQQPSTQQQQPQQRNGQPHGRGVLRESGPLGNGVTSASMVASKKPGLSASTSTRAGPVEESLKRKRDKENVFVPSTQQQQQQQQQHTTTQHTTAIHNDDTMASLPRDTKRARLAEPVTPKVTASTATTISRTTATTSYAYATSSPTGTYTHSVPRSPTATINTKNALASIMPMFSSNVTETFNTKQLGSPTMTINSKVAAADVAAMFAAPLTFEKDVAAPKSSASAFKPAQSSVSSSSSSSGGGGQRRPLGLSQPERKTTFGDIIKQKELETGVKLVSEGNGAKRTNRDAIMGRYLDEEDEDEEEEAEDSEFIDTGVITDMSMPVAPPMAIGGFAIFEDTTGPITAAPLKPVVAPVAVGGLKVFEDNDNGDGDGDRSAEDYLAADDITFGTTGGITTTFGDTSIMCDTGDHSPVPQPQQSIASRRQTGPVPSFQMYEDPASPAPISTRTSNRASTAGKRASVSTAAASPSPRSGRSISSRRGSSMLAARGETTKAAAPQQQQQAPAGPVIDPFDPSHVNKHVSTLLPQIKRYPGVADCSGEKAPGARLLKTPKGKRASMGGADPTLYLKDLHLELEKRIGDGAFATVHLVEKIDDGSTSDIAAKSYALKVQDPPCWWEYYVYNQIKRRVDQTQLHSFIKMHSLHVYSDKSLILMDYFPWSLQDLINEYRKVAKPLDEVLIIYYTIEMLKTLHALHKAQLIHGDLKPDNILVRLEESEVWENYGTGSAGGWDQRGIALIDFGKSIDVSLYQPGTRFIGDSGADQFRCAEMRENRPWTYQSDLFALCGVVHCLLHAKYMDVIQYNDGGVKKWKAREAFKRYWQSDLLWKPLFDGLLNHEVVISATDGAASHLEMLRRFAAQFEEYLHASDKAKLVRTLLTRQNIMMFKN